MRFHSHFEDKIDKNEVNIKWKRRIMLVIESVCLYSRRQSIDQVAESFRGSYEDFLKIPAFSARSVQGKTSMKNKP